ncbi:hypothetical protein PTKIN_Ptkin18bG0024600 [Pterospermum kingtungense]
MERLIKNEQTHHIKNSEKRVLARKNLEHKIRSQDLAGKLQTILIKKVRGKNEWCQSEELFLQIHGIKEDEGEGMVVRRNGKRVVVEQWRSEAVKGKAAVAGLGCSFSVCLRGS